MDASLLLVGTDEFVQVLSAQLTPWFQGSIRAIATAEAARVPIETHPPDLVIAEASPAANDLCHHLKQQVSLAWVYCILVQLESPDAGNANFPTCELYVAQGAKALVQGADAYVYLPHALQVHPPITPETLTDNLLYAQIQVGLRVVRAHQHLMQTNGLLSAIALTDPLTQLSNRRALEWELTRSIQNARLRNLPLSLLILDVDYFKVVNDTYGHLVGDQALKLIADRLRQNLRFYDIPFRYGGEEFVVLLTNSDHDDALVVAERLCQLIREQPFVVEGAHSLAITISVGLSVLQANDDLQGINLLKRADHNLLRAKTSGRNRVVGVADPMAPMAATDNPLRRAWERSRPAEPSALSPSLPTSS